jgi:hypothetical protein
MTRAGLLTIRSNHFHQDPVRPMMACAEAIGHALASIDGHLARGLLVSPKHDFLARHEHEPNTMLSGSGRCEHKIGLVLDPAQA